MTHSRPLTLPWLRPASSTPSSTTSTMFPWPRSQHWPPEMPPAVCSAECKFVAISPFSQSLIWKRARSASAGRAFPVFRKAHCAFTHTRKPPGTVCRLDALQLQTLSIRTGGRSPRLAFSPVSSGASQASYGAAGSGTRLPNGARSLSRRRNANASSSAQPVRPVRSL